MNQPQPTDDELDFGPLPAPVNALLQRGVAAHFQAPAEAEALFREAIRLAPGALPAHRCLFKHYNRHRQFDAAHACALAWLEQAALLTGLPADWRHWRAHCGGPATGEALRALPALKALAFIQLRRGAADESAAALQQLAALDPADGVGWSVVAALHPLAEAA